MDYLNYGNVISITIPLLYHPSYDFMVISGGIASTDSITPQIARSAAHYFIEAVRCTCLEMLLKS